MKQKKIPMRMCSGCGEMKPKRELVRVVKAPSSKTETADENAKEQPEISLDLTGKKPGRGAYICKNADCLQKARKARRFEKAFSCSIPDEVFEKMTEEILHHE